MRRVHKAWDKAQRLLNEHNVRRAPVEVQRIAEQYARVVPRPLEDDISGVLVPINKSSWVILVNSMHSPVRQRFTIAHELGHLLLHSYTAPHADRAFRFRDTRSSEGSALEEIQANQFAAELLMPRDLVLKAAGERFLEHGGDEVSDAAFEHRVEVLARKFDVSKQAMLIRISSLFA